MTTIAPAVLWDIVREVDEWSTPHDFLRSLNERGLSLCTDADRAVLDEMTAIPKAALESWIARGFMTVLGIARAELARRGYIDKPVADGG